ncbi:hypothetical protein [Geoalkalibacter subterraneus]|jgi:hypothetical protein|uniref:Transposase n=1 Tax=Geoalkalibacter subterraneus TaxID=483547 RepID=A0A0B5FJN4_9BACT|nr:hypothetical protein [Geoalkalibacter subterraneus]AJF07558.1 hypothetical protein GSUB_14750 [Geoalkalibacter subterraneus]
MNIYEEEDLEQKLDELTDLMGRIVLDLLLVSLRKINKEQQVYGEFVETRGPSRAINDPE